MPRDGTENYVLPFPDVEEDTTIESAVYNGFTNDVAQDLNTPRPISSGGTGATNADEALSNMGGEKAAMVVTNYDSHVWQAGSFYSASSATAGPVDGHAFSGIAYVSDPPATPPANLNVVVEARDATDEKLYIRRKTAGVWGVWAAEGAADYVNVAGDTMTGNLVIAKSGPRLILNGADVLGGTGIVSQIAGLTRWAFYMGNGTAEAGGNAGSDFNVARFNDAGAQIGGSIFTISRATGDAAFGGAVNVGGGAVFGGAVNVNSLSVTGRITAGNDILAYNAVTPASGTMYFGNAGTGYITYQGGAFTTSSSFNVTGTLVANGINSGDIRTVRPASNSGYIYFGTTAENYLGYNGAEFILLSSSAVVMSSGGGTFQVYPTNFVAPNVFAGTNGYKPGGGVWAATSDARIKNVEGEYTRGLEDVVQLRPVYYTFKGNDTRDPPAHIKTGDQEKDAANAELPLTVPYPNSGHGTVATSGTRYAGLVAQEVETVFPEMVTQRSAYIDGQPVNDMRDLDTTPLIFALVNAVKELKMKVEALEAR